MYSSDYVVVRKLLNESSHLTKSRKRKASVPAVQSKEKSQKKSKPIPETQPDLNQKIERVDSFMVSANKYMNYYVASRNADGFAFAECSKNICTPNCEAEIYVKPKNALDFAFLNLIPLDRWILSISSMQMLAPDGIMKISNVHHLHTDSLPSLLTMKSIDCDNSTSPTSSKSSSDLIRIDLPPSAVPPASFLYTHRDDEIAFLAELDSTGTLIYEKNSVANADENSDRPTIISLLKEQQQQPLTPLRSEAIQSYHIRAFLIFRRKFGEKVHKIEYFYEFL